MFSKSCAEACIKIVHEYGVGVGCRLHARGHAAEREVLVEFGTDCVESGEQRGHGGEAADVFVADAFVPLLDLPIIQNLLFT